MTSNISTCSSNTESRQSNQQTDKRYYDPFWFIGCALLFIVLSLLGYSEYTKHIEKKERANVISSANSEIPNLFSTWTAFTIDGESVVEWRGDLSTFLYLEDMKYSGEKVGWRVWAKSSTGRIFRVRYFLNSKLLFQAQDPKNSDREALIKVLFRDGRTDLMKKLEVPINPA